MKGENEKWRPCTFYSKLLSNVERNYDVHNKEMLGIIRVLEAWRHHVEGAMHKVEIWSDHRDLQYFMGAKKLNRRQVHWALYLLRFDFEMIHKPGASMGKTDALSRSVKVMLNLAAEKCGKSAEFPRPGTNRTRLQLIRSCAFLLDPGVPISGSKDRKSVV